MADLIKSILDKFTHLLRDLLFYFISGFLVIVYVSYLYFDIEKISYNGLYVFCGIVFSFVLGHILMVFSKICDVFKSKEEKQNPNKYLENEISIFMHCTVSNKSKDVYDQFIERYNTLYLFRRVLSVSFFLMFFLSLIYLCFSIIDLFNTYALNDTYNTANLFSDFDLLKLIISIVTLFFSFLFSIILIFGAIKTKDEMNDRIEIIHKKQDILKNNE